MTEHNGDGLNMDHDHDGDEIVADTDHGAGGYDHPSSKKDKSDDKSNRGYSNTLRVKADPPDVTAEERKKNSKNLAGAIAHGLRQYGEVYVRCFSNATCGKASKAIAIARGFVAVQGFDLYCAPSFITADIGGKERTGICYWVFTNQTNVGKE